MKCPHECKVNLKNKDDYPRTPKGLYQCNLCKCWFREVSGANMKSHIVLVAWETECFNKHHPEMVQFKTTLKEVLKEKRKVKK